MSAHSAINPTVSQPSQVKALPDLTVSARSPAYTLNPGCSYGGAAITFHLTVSNVGAGASTVINQQQGGVMVQTAIQSGTSGTLWSGAATLPAIPAHGSVPIDVIVMPLTTASAMAGTHVFSALVNPLKTIQELSNDNNSTDISVDVPSGFCPNRMLKPNHPLVTPATSAPSMDVHGNPSKLGKYSHSQGSFALEPLPAPQNLTYTNDPTVCKAHIAGLGAALVCPGLIASAVTLPLVWDWQACKAQNCEAQPDGTITIRGISPFSKTDCYVVTAFKGSKESLDSNKWCGNANLVMGFLKKTVSPTTTLSLTGDPLTGCYATIRSDEPLDGIEFFVDQNGKTNTCFYHTYFDFDLSLYQGIKSAIFHANVAQQMCLKGIEEGPWLDAQPIPRWLPGGDPSTEIDFDSVTSSEVTVDITSWAKVGPHKFPNLSSFAVTFVGANESANCKTYVGGAWIDIQFTGYW